MKPIPTQKENPNGLHQRYVVEKIVKTEIFIPNEGGAYRGSGNWRDINEFAELPENASYRHITKPVDKDAKYFVLRLDTGGSDINHIKACRIGVNAYADAIEPFIPELAKDLRERYPLL